MDSRQAAHTGDLLERHRMGRWCLWSRGGGAYLLQYLGCRGERRSGRFSIGDHSRPERRAQSGDPQAASRAAQESDRATDASRRRPQRPRLKDDRVCFDLHKDTRIDQPADLDHARRRPNITKDLSVRPPDFLPLVDVGYIDSRAHDILETGSSSPKRGFDVLESLDRLSIGVALTHDVA